MSMLDSLRRSQNISIDICQWGTIQGYWATLLLVTLFGALVLSFANKLVDWALVAILGTRGMIVVWWVVQSWYS
jgi:hypothetical protein